MTLYGRASDRTNPNGRQLKLQFDLQRLVSNKKTLAFSSPAQPAHPHDKRSTFVKTQTLCAPPRA